jgi:hypothetical protein
MRVRYEMFESSMSSWETLFTQAADFATRVGPDRLIGISHSEGKRAFDASNNGVVTVWYWESASEGPK